MLLAYLLKLYLTEVLVATYFAQRRHSARVRDRGATIGVRRDIVNVVNVVIRNCYKKLL